MPRVKRTALFDGDPTKKPRTLLALCRELLDSLDTLQDTEQSRQLVTAFVKLPSRKIYPDYYALIDTPISINRILKKVAKDAYASVEEFVADFRLMHDNAVKYNDPESWIVADVAKILAFVEAQAPQVALHADEEPANVNIQKVCMDVLDNVVNHDFPGEGRLSRPFLDDIDPHEYPDYFQVIAQPTSFLAVRSKVELGALFADENSLAENLQAFSDATMMIFSNAQDYNDPSSLIHEDLNKLRRVFSEKLLALKHELGVDAEAGIKLTIKVPKEPVKLKISLKGTAATVVAGSAENPAVSIEQPPKKRRGRKPKKLIEEEQRLAALEATRIKEEQGIVDGEKEADNEGTDADGDALAPLELCAMGKLKTAPSSDDVFVRNVAFTSSHTFASQLMDAWALQPEQPLLNAQIVCNSVYPEAPLTNMGTFFEYRFAPLGYSTKAYSITLPRDSTPVVNFKVALHELIYNLKRRDLSDGQGLLKNTAEEDFMCSLFLNDEEVDNGCEMREDVDPADKKTKLLNLTYELKLNYGLNMISFELRISPNLSKSLKKRVEEEPAEIAGRQTRHQMQQIKLNWDVEKFTLFVVSHGP